MSDLTLNNPQPNSIVFNVPLGREVMRITADGVVVANGVTVDEASAAVIAALSGYIRNMVADKDAEIKRLKAEMQIRVEAGKRMVERRDAEIERLRTALTILSDHWKHGYGGPTRGDVIRAVEDISKAALAQEKPNG
jgi:hypothetical protein